MHSSYYDKLGTMAAKSSRLTGIRDVSTTTIMNFAVPQAPRRIVGSKYYYCQFTSTMIITLLICVYTPPPSSTYFTRHYKDCFWDGNSCRSNHDIDDRDLCRVGRSECNGDEICVALDRIVWGVTYCLDDILGQCVREPRSQVCPSTKDEVCGCDGFTYDNACKCLAAGRNVKYEGPCSSAMDRDFRKNIRDLDKYQDNTNELLRQFVYSSTSTDGDICLTELECDKQSLYDNAPFDTVQDPNNCGCFEWKGRYYFSDHNKCSQKKMKTLSLQNTRVRVHCDLDRLYRNVRNYPYDTCLTADECEDQCELDNLAPMKIRNSDTEKGCYRRKGNRKCYWSGGGSNVQKSSSLSGDFKRVECTDTSRDVRNVVSDTCLTRGECEAQGLIDGDVKLPSFAKYDTHCGCYKKGGSLYWGYCDFGDFSTPLGGQKQRVNCRDVNKSYRVFERDGTAAGHTHWVSLSSLLYCSSA
jgi:hypothetical protein